MKMPGASHASLLLAIIAGCSVSEAERHRLIVRSNRTNYKIDWWDNGRADPYRIIFKKNGVKSVYKFLESGSLSTLTIGNTRYTFSQSAGSLEVQSSEDISSRMLLAPGDESANEVHSGHRRLYDCPDCEETWDTLCDVGIEEVCYWVELLPSVFYWDAQYSLTVMCTAMGAACDTSAADTCEGQCIEGPAPEPTPAPIADPTPAPIIDPTPAPITDPTPAPITDPTPAPITDPTPAPITDPTPAPIIEPTPAPITDPTPAPIIDPTPAPIIDPTPATPAPVEEETPDACNPSPCENGGSCSIDPAGGHRCSCASGFGGMACQIDTSSLDTFYIEVDYIGTWTDARKAVFDTAAERWSQVITHVPCGGTVAYPAGRLLISATLEEIDGSGGTLGSAGPTSIWNACNTISLLGAMRFDIDDIADMEDNGTFEGVIQHEMGHVIGVGTLWGVGYGDCTTCRDDGDPAWTCPAALSEYYDIGGTDSDIVETDGGSGTSCGHLDEDIFDDELMTGYVDSTMYMSKMTAAILDDLDYIVDPSAVDSYTLPSERGASINKEEGLAITFNDTVVDTIILVVSEDGTSVEREGVMMVF
eukprot:jgi/Undpi1/2863/HiC_scaffold_14.g06240.m1